MMQKLKPVLDKAAYSEPVEAKIMAFLHDQIFAFIAFVMDDVIVSNAKSSIEGGIRSGALIYKDGVIRPRKRFTNAHAKEIEALGGKFNKIKGGYVIAPRNLSATVHQAIAETNIKNQNKIAEIKTHLDGVQEKMDYAASKLDFGAEVNRVIKGLDGQFHEAMGKVDVVPLDLNDAQKAEIADRYTNNMRLYIKKWETEAISRLRTKIDALATEGYRADKVRDMLRNEYGISRNKARFLARQETSLLVSKYRETRFKAEGIDRYEWVTNLDGREREDHKLLNGKIFSWDNPPIIDRATGETGHPGEAFGCRCRAIPIVEGFS